MTTNGRPADAGSRRECTSRTEHDLLGERRVPHSAYYGIHTLRAMENFPITGTPLARHPALVVALAQVKHAAALANRELGLLAPEKAAAITAACEEIAAGRWHDQFTVDVIQGGAGTSSHMNANEVIANRALELLGHPKGAYEHLHPLDSVNQGQSTNDVYPTAVKIALRSHADALLAALAELRAAFTAKGKEFAEIVKVGRTQLQDAVPMTLGQEFSAFAATLAEDEQRLTEAAALLHEINLGGTAIGTGLNAHPRYPQTVCRHLRHLTGLPLVTSGDLVEATQDTGVFVHLSGVLKRVAVKLSKICNDLRLLSSGPQTGLNELNLPRVQAGSSIMPGKVNPVIPEVVNQIAFEVIGNDLTVTMAAEAGQLQLNAFEPIIAHALLTSAGHLTAGCRTLATRCVSGITANAGRLRRQVEESVGVITALTTVIGYEAASALAKQAVTTRRSIRDLLRESGTLDDAQLDELLSPARLTGPAAAQP
ncbi:aspartate ammonia-lyase [Streptomyces sp. NRRL F-4489]|uniref:aspartate ammonia-lyase n=1 Tax=Streptomyces sp. NRRL F-4489 TaxID=1609095 RepID=UPI0007478C7B|nr:aspartate ammonia-lyase [Streptomyces sp. NRRL F-4489]KUL55366.1 aspartate ammonia-lyase [Streptomyces sp. NRRL F-4489]